MKQRSLSGPWRQDDLEPRIVLDGDGEFFAIGISGPESERIVAALNAAARADAERSTAVFERHTRAEPKNQEH